MSRLLFLLFSLLLLHVNAVPVPRQGAPLPQPTTLQTTQTQNTSAGQMTTTCTIKLTPIKDKDGKDAVEEVTTCKVAMNGGTNNGANGGDSSASQGGSTSTSASGAASTDGSAGSGSGSSSSSSSVSSSSSDSGSAASSGAAPAASGSASGGAAPPVKANGVSSIPKAAVQSLLSSGSGAAPAASSTGSSAPASSGGGGAQAGGVSQVPASAASGGSPTAAAQSTAQSASAAAAQDSSSASPSAAGSFELPGKKLSVLPIGLGVFAGISVIALIVVGLVTYERTKYRKAFRQRKLAEQGAAMGYSGNMAERT